MDLHFQYFFPALSGYACKCDRGYELSSSGTCRDVDECADRKRCRGGRCRNTRGGFECVCPPGFDPSYDGSECLDQDECGLTGRCAHGTCLNERGSFRCLCDDGFRPSASGLSCRDVDECAENPRLCARGGRCRNTPGSYVCECRAGFVHSADGGFCLDEDECAADERGGDVGDVGDGGGGGGRRRLCRNGRCVNTEGAFKCLCDPG